LTPGCVEGKGGCVWGCLCLCLCVWVGGGGGGGEGKSSGEGREGREQGGTDEQTREGDEGEGCRVKVKGEAGWEQAPRRGQYSPQTPNSWKPREVWLLDVRTIQLVMVAAAVDGSVAGWLEGTAPGNAEAAA